MPAAEEHEEREAVDDGSAAEVEEEEEEVDPAVAEAKELLEFKHNCQLIERGLSVEDADPATNVHTLNTWIDWIQKGSGTPAKEQHFYRVTLPRITDLLLKRAYSETAGQPQATQHNFFRRMLQIIVQKMDDDLDEMADALRRIFNDAAPFYLLYGQRETRGVPPEVAEAAARGEYGRDAWALTLAVGDLLDVLDEGDGKEEDGADGSGAAAVWRRARVLKLSSAASNMVLLAVEGAEASEWRSLDELLLAPADSGGIFGTKALPDLGGSKKEEDDEEWRRSLHIGSMCDAQDGVHKWYQAIIVEEKDGENGDSSDDDDGGGGAGAAGDSSDDDDSYVGSFVKLTYVGWPRKYDDWFSRASLRIAPLNSRSKGMRGRGAVRLTALEVDLPLGDEFDSGDSFAVRRARACTSQLLVDNVNFFGELGGFEALQRRMAAADLPPKQVRAYAIAIAKIAPILSRPFAASWLPQFADAVAATMLAMDDAAMRNMGQNLVSDVTLAVRHMLCRCGSRDAAGEVVEQLTLALAAKCYRTDFLQRRLNGLALLQDCVRHARNARLYPDGVRVTRNALGSYTVTERKAVTITRWLTVEKLADWLAESSIIADALVGERAHTELLKRLVDVLNFLAAAQRLDGDSLRLLWDAALSSDSERRATALSVLGHISSQLSAELLEFLTDSIAAVPMADFDDPLLELVQRLAAPPPRAAKESTVSSPRALDLLMKLLQDGVAGVTPAMTAAALEKLEAVLSRTCVLPHRHDFMQRCVDNLAAHHSVPQSLHLLRRIIATFPTQPKADGQPNKWSVIVWLQDAHHLLPLFFDDLLAYKASVRDAVAAARREAGGSDDAAVDVDVDAICVSPSVQTHQEQISGRLDFLHYLLLYSPLTLVQEQMEVLWEQLQVGALSGTERDALWAWLARALIMATEEDGFVAFQDDVVHWLFADKMCTPELARQLTPEGFRCLHRFFVFVNQRAGNVVLNAAGQLELLSLDIVGFDALWLIALQGGDTAVVDACVKLLMELQDWLCDALLPKLQLFRQEYVRRCMGQLADALEDVAAADGSGDAAARAAAQRTVMRCLRLLRAMLDDTDPTTARQLSSHGRQTAGKTLTLTMQNLVKGSSSKGKKFKVTISSNETAWDLRSLLGRTVGLATPRVRVFHGIEEMHDRDNNLTLGMLKFKDGDVLICSSREAPSSSKRRRDVDAVAAGAGGDGVGGDGVSVSPAAGDTPPAGGVDSRLRALPAYILSYDRRHFNQLFRLLDPGLGDDIAAAAWALLMRIPTNPHIREGIVALELGDGAAGWNALLDSGSPFRLLYALQIVEGLIAPPGDDGDVAVQRSDWQQRFLLQGGFAHLYGTLMDMAPPRGADEDGGGLVALRVTCAATLVKVVKFFVTSAFTVARPEVADVLQLARAMSKLRVSPAKKGGKEGGKDSGSEDGKEGGKEDGGKKEEAAAPAPGAAAPPAAAPLPPPTLLRQMSGRSSASLLELVDMAALAEQVLRFVSAAVQGGSSSSDSDLVDSGLGLWRALVLFTPALLAAFLDGPRASVLLPAGILCASGESAARVRKEFAEGFYKLVRYVPAAAVGLPAGQTPQRRLLALLLELMPGTADAVAQVSDQYFVLVNMLLRDAASGRDGGPAELFEALRLRLVEHVLHATPLERSGNRRLRDKVLIGVFQLLATLAAESEEARQQIGVALIGHLLGACLFQLPTLPDLEAADDSSLLPPLCKTVHSRRAAFRLLTALVKGDSSNMSALLRQVSPMLASTQKVVRWSYDPSKDARAHGYVGLRNLGCICYMNSLMQQFFMMPQLRWGLLSVDDKEEDKKESILFQLQVMFGFLSQSERKAFSPAAWCHAYKDEEGRPTNVLLQQDAQEYFNVLCDRVENRLRGTAQANLLRNVFGGKLSNQLICHGDCGRCRDRPEDYYTVSVEVKGKPDLYASLDTFVEGEIISDYNCDECGRKVDTTKRVCLDKLGNTLILHLKRFEFNFDTFQREKLNDRFEFPEKLNVEPYTKEGLAWREAKRAKDAAEEEAAAGDGDGEGDGDGDGDGAGDGDGSGGDGGGDGAAAAGAGAEEGGKADEAAEEDVPLEPYTVHPQSYYEYELVGVVVHTGTADAGHYYSFIKERDDGSEGRWFEFNDKDVRPFQLRDLDSECYGGTKRITVYSSALGRMTERLRPVTRNAYMLVYSRVQPIEVEEEDVEGEPAGAAAAGGAAGGAAAATGGDDGAPEEDEPASDKKDGGISKLAELVAAADGSGGGGGGGSGGVVVGGGSRRMPARIFQWVHEDNLRFLHHRHVYSPDFYSFMLEVMRAGEAPALTAYDGPVSAALNPGLPLVSLGVDFTLTLLSHAEDCRLLPEFCKVLAAHFDSNIPAAVAFLSSAASDPSLVADVLLGCRDVAVRRAVADLLNHVLQLVSQFERHNYMATELVPAEVSGGDASGAADADAMGGGGKADDGDGGKEGGEDDEDDAAPAVRFSSVVARFIDAMLVLTDAAALNWDRFSEYFLVLRRFAELGREERAFLVKREAIMLALDMYLADYSPANTLRWKGTKKRPTMGNTYSLPDWTNLMDYVALLVTSCGTTVDDDTDLPSTATLEAPLLEMDFLSRKCVLTKPFYVVSLRDGHNPAAVARIMCHWAWEWADYTDSVIEVVQEGLRKANWDDVAPYFDVMEQFFALDDSLRDERLTALLEGKTGLLRVAEIYRTKYARFSYHCIKHLMRLCAKNEVLASHMAGIRDQWLWAEGFLRGYVRVTAARAGEAADAAAASAAAYSDDAGQAAAAAAAVPELARQQSALDTLAALEEQVLRFGGTLGDEVDEDLFAIESDEAEDDDDDDSDYEDAVG